MSTQVGSGAAMPQRRRDMAEWRREQIIDAALLVFGTKGVHAASEGGRRCGRSHLRLALSLLHQQRGPFVAVTVERGFLAELRSLLSEEGERPAVVVLPEVTAGFGRILGSASRWWGYSCRASDPKIRAGLDEILSETHRLLGNYLSDRVAAGELRPHDSHALVSALFSTCAFGYLLGQPVDPTAVAEIVLRGIMAQP